MKRPGMKRIAAVITALLLLPSCGFLEMREAMPETEPASDGVRCVGSLSPFGCTAEESNPTVTSAVSRLR